MLSGRKRGTQRTREPSDPSCNLRSKAVTLRRPRRDLQEKQDATVARLRAGLAILTYVRG